MVFKVLRYCLVVFKIDIILTFELFICLLKVINIFKHLFSLFLIIFIEINVFFLYLVKLYHQVPDLIVRRSFALNSFELCYSLDKTLILLLDLLKFFIAFVLLLKQDLIFVNLVYFVCLFLDKLGNFSFKELNLFERTEYFDWFVQNDGWIVRLQLVMERVEYFAHLFHFYGHIYLSGLHDAVVQGFQHLLVHRLHLWISKSKAILLFSVFFNLRLLLFDLLFEESDLLQGFGIVLAGLRS